MGLSSSGRKVDSRSTNGSSILPSPTNMLTDEQKVRRVENTLDGNRRVFRTTAAQHNNEFRLVTIYLDELKFLQFGIHKRGTASYYPDPDGVEFKVHLDYEQAFIYDFKTKMQHVITHEIV